MKTVVLRQILPVRSWILLLTATAVASAWLSSSPCAETGGPRRRRHCSSRTTLSYLQAVRSTEPTENTTFFFSTSNTANTYTQSPPPFTTAAAAATTTATVQGPDPSTQPDYETTAVGPLGKSVDRWLLQRFRRSLAEQVGFDALRPVHDYRAITELAAALNVQHARNTTELERRAVQVLLDLFPPWLPPWYAVLFARPFPQFSARMNAWATWVAGTWLMGECEVNDVVVVAPAAAAVADPTMADAAAAAAAASNATTTSTTILRGQGLRVKRCRFLEETGCASVCVHACQIPTQTFFRHHMGLPLTMEPNYDTFECQFSFGVEPTAATDRAARSTPCLARCPAQGSLRQNHPATIMEGGGSATANAAAASSSSNSGVETCAMMGDT